jgi:hypothetical protein
MLTRRDFIETGLAGTAAASAGHSENGAANGPENGPETGGVPWFRRVLRWGQTNITERDPVRYDIAWWREYWKRTEVQGVIVNAGGIVAYYPSKFPLQHRAEFLNGRDLFGELTRAAHDDGLVVLARMDSNRAAEDLFRAHPDWFARQLSGQPYRAEDKYVTCVNSAYYDEYIPGILTEIVERSRPEGFTDNSWSGLGRDSICYCENCARKFRDKTGQDLPRAKDWSSPVYRQWIEWNYERRLEVWDLNNRVTKAAGGPECLWIGMNSGSISTQSRSFRNFAEICKRSEIVLLDHQARADSTGFQQNAETGKLVHGLLGWDKLMPESMALYQNARNQFRLASKPAAEARMWMIAGIAGGIQPWWHHVGAYHEDRRMYHTAEPVFRWHKENARYLVDRRPVAAVGVVWSQKNTDYYGRDEAAELVDAPYRGWIQALIRARIPYVPVCADHIERDAGEFSALALPNLGALSDEQCAAIRQFSARGGGVVATGATSLYNEWGDARPDFALAALFGAHATASAFPRRGPGSGSPNVTQTVHSYLRLTPELRGQVWGPKAGDEPVPQGERHAVLRGFEETDIVAFGGLLEPMRLDADVTVPLTFVPPFPTFPPETAWMRQPKTDVPALALRMAGESRVAYLAADLDRRYANENLPDHGDILANLVRWATAGRIPLEVRGAGLIDCHLYRQQGRAILHLVNLTNAGAWRAPMEELIPVGPLQVRVRLPRDVRGHRGECLVAGRKLAVAMRGNWAEFELRTVLGHEVVLIE